MSQVDLATFPVIVFWTFLIFGASFLLFISEFLPLFISKTKSLFKAFLFSYVTSYYILCKINISEYREMFVSLLMQLRESY